MTNVVDIALDRRAKLREEIRRLDEFLYMAEALIRSCKPSEVPSVPDNPTQMPTHRTARVAATSTALATQRGFPEPEPLEAMDVHQPIIIRCGASR